MKKTILVLLSFLLVFALCGCGETATTYTVEKAGIAFEVDTENSTISDGTYTYKYTFSGDAESYAVKITYPNGSTYYWNQSGTSGQGGWSDDYDRDLYVDGGTLCDVAAAKAPKASAPTNVFGVLLLIGIGVFNLAAPQAAWYLSYGWRYKNAEPSDTALIMARVSGVAVLVIALLMIIS